MTLIMDIETKTYGKPDPYNDQYRVFGYHDVEKNKSGIIIGDIEKVKELIKQHKVLIGFNNKGYDNPILERFGISFYNHIVIDLYQVFKKKHLLMPITLRRFSLAAIAKELGIAQKQDDFDYEILNKKDWYQKDVDLIKEYTLQDIKVLYEMWKHVEEFFKPFAGFLNKYDQIHYKHLTASSGSYAYKVICNELGISEEYNDDVEHNKYAGGYVLEPTTEFITGNLYCLDFNCLIKGTKILTEFGEKSIEDINIGDKIKTINGYTKVTDIRNRKAYKVQSIKTNTRDIIMTDDHRMLTISDNNTVLKSAKMLKKGDKLLCLKRDIHHGIKEKNAQKYLILENKELEKKIQIGKGGKKKDTVKTAIKNLKNTHQNHINIVQKNVHQLVNQEIPDGQIKNTIQKNIKNYGKNNAEYQNSQLQKINHQNVSEIEQNIETGEIVYLKEINTLAKNVKNVEDIYKHTTKKNGQNIKKIDTKLKTEQPSVYDATENYIKPMGILRDGEKHNLDNFEIVEIQNIIEQEYDDYVYDITVENRTCPYFIANGFISHNSMYPHAYIQANLFSNNCKCCTEDEKYKGGELFDLQGSYCSKHLGKIEQVIKKFYNKRLEYKKQKDPREYAIKIIINTMYGICGNPVFKNLYNINTASDCTLIARDCVKLARDIFKKHGYNVIYGDTDSIYLEDVFDDEEKMIKIKDIIINKIKTSLPFPQDTFDMGIDDRIKLMFVPNLKKKNYIYVTTDNNLIIKGLPLKKSNASKLSMVVFDKHIKKNIIYFDAVKFNRDVIKKWVSDELENDINLAALEFKVNSVDSYINESQLQCQISKAYGRGIHKLIPNLCKVGAGKAKGYCTFEEFKKEKLLMRDIDLSKTYSELNVFCKDNLMEKKRKRMEKTINTFRGWMDEDSN